MQHAWWYRAFGCGCVMALVLTAGCDTVGSNTQNVVLPERSLTARFAFSSSAMQQGSTLTVGSGGMSLDGNLDGFTRADILSAEVTGAQIRLLQPVQDDLDVFSDAAVDVTASSLPPVAVAQRSGFEATNTADLTVSSGVDVGSYARQQQFAFRLRITPAGPTSDEDFIVDVTLQLRIVVEGV